MAFDLVLEHKLALLEAFELHLIDMDVHRQPGDDIVEVAVFDAQPPQLVDVAEQLAVDVVLFLVGHSETGRDGFEIRG